MARFPFLKRAAKPTGDAEKKSSEKAKLRTERNEYRDIAKKVRQFASFQFIKGEGIEIGGLHRPLKIFGGAKVRYVDRLSTEEVRKYYPNVEGEQQVTVDIVDDGETLATIADGSCDFVIANHMLEHTRNPIATLGNFLRVLRPGGVVYMAIPDKRFTFDIKRDVTPYEHLKRDYLEGPDWSDREHYEDWAKNVTDPPDAETEKQRVEHFIEQKHNIHFHVWTQREIFEFLLNVQRDFGWKFDIEAAIKNGLELLIVLRKAE